jgi:ATP-binding cassette subfamily B protein
MPRRFDFSANLILVCNSLDTGGIERVVSTLANEWSRRGQKVCVVTLHDRRRFYQLDSAIHHVIIDRAGLNRIADLLRWLAAHLHGKGVSRLWLLNLICGGLYRLSYRHLYRAYHSLVYACEAALLRRALKRIQSPLIISLGTPINIITLKACKGLKRRVIISERNDPKRLSRFKQWDVLARKLYNHADLVTANTRAALRDMSSYVEAEKLAFVPNPLAFSADDDDGMGGDAAPSDSPFVLNVGRMVWDKAQEVLLDAFTLLGEEFNEWRLAMIGDGRLDTDLRARAMRLGIADRVDWHGIVRDPFIFYRAASIFVLPSRVEGTPNALLEAMSCGLPVIVSDGAPGPLELVEDGVTGLVVPVNDAAVLAAAIRRLLSGAGEIYTQCLYLKDLFDFFETKPTVASRAGAPAVPKPLKEGFTFEGVGYRYPGSETWALRGVTLRLRPGERLALVGGNGAGKTTLVKLLARLYDPTEGRILLDGRDLRDYDLESLRKSVGVIFQDFYRYDLRFDENIGVGEVESVREYLESSNEELSMRSASGTGRPMAEAQKVAAESISSKNGQTPPVIVSAAEKSLAATLLARLPEKYRQMLGRRFEGGVDLSGGEWQKIALARAYMRDAQMLILDEPTASLDARAEYEVFRRFAELMEGRMAVIISHRFSTVRMADRIIVLDEGRVVEEGTHMDLVARGGLYAELFALQAAGYR